MNSGDSVILGRGIMNIIDTSFFVPLEHVPTTTAQQARIISGFGGFVKFDNPKLAAARATLAFGLRPCAPYKPFKGPVELFTEWRFDYKKGHKDGEYKDTRPDTDNLNKMLKDIMTSLGFWEDDKQVVMEHIKKVWDKTDPGIWIRIRRVDKFEKCKLGKRIEEPEE